jgi:hypothetical protein
MFHIALIIGHVVVDLRMRVAVFESRDGRFHGDRFRHIVGRISVVSEYRGETNQEKANHTD